MSTSDKRIYEGLFLFPQNAISDMQSASDHVQALIERVDGELVSFRKWDDRRLAYEIKGNKRGLYFLAYFNCDPTKVVDLERHCNLSEELLRALVIRADHLNKEDIEAAEGRSSLADEIKLRSEESVESTESSSTVTVGKQTEDVQVAADKEEEKKEIDEKEPSSEETPTEA